MLPYLLRVHDWVIDGIKVAGHTRIRGLYLAPGAIKLLWFINGYLVQVKQSSCMALVAPPLWSFLQSFVALIVIIRIITLV